MRIRNAFLTIGAALLMAGTARAATKAETRTQACQQYTQVNSALKNLKDIGPSSTIGDFRSAERDLASSYDRFSNTAQKVAKPETKRLDDSIHQLEDTVNNVPSDATIQQARAMIKGDIARVQVSKTELLGALGCQGMPNQMDVQ